MHKRTEHKSKRQHYCLLVNKQATNYSYRAVSRLIGAIKRQGHNFTVLEPPSAKELLHLAQVASGTSRHRRPLQNEISRRGPFTALIACGGDGTFNLVARAGLKGNIPIGIYPLGKYNNIARSIYGSDRTDEAVKRILKGHKRHIDCGKVVNQYFFGSVGIGFFPELMQNLENKKLPRFALGWSSLAGKSTGVRLPKDALIKIDSFKFEFSPVIFNVNLLPYTVGLPVSRASIFDDNKAEIIFDAGATGKDISTYLTNTVKGKFNYGDEIRSFRGNSIAVQPVKDYQLYLDGEIIDLPVDMIEIQVNEKQIQVFG